jgi:Mycobacterial cell wall arabinan synthesis protein/EmbC C-terminal domain/Arabinosyltransferase concanavalin like domain
VGVLAALAVLVLVSAVGVLLAPVIADDPVVSWPRAGEPPRSTVLPLVPYRPLSLDASVPCAALAALDRRASGGEALRTLPATAGLLGHQDQSDWIGQGVVVAVHHGIVQVTASGVELVREALPTGGCTYRVLADAGGVRVLRDGVQRGSASLLVPEVSELATDAEGQPEAAGLAVSLHTDARYESTPTALKIGLLVVHTTALVVLLGLAWWWGGGQTAPVQLPILQRTRTRVADAVLVVISAGWVLLAPTNFDDPWYLLMARGAHASGSVGNAIYMFNATENPFVASQYVLQAWGAVGGWSLVWMRLVPLVYGLLTWVLLRLLLAAGFGRELGTGRAVWALLVAYLLWWLPYGMTLRPEPLIVLLAAATLLLAELARQRRSVGALAAATSTAALALSVSPSGLAAAAPLVLALPWLWVWLRTHGTGARVAAVLLLAAAGTSVVLVGCADATLGDVLESTAMHQWYYQSFPWYREFVHYQTILSFQDSSQWARRAPIVFTVAVIVVVVVSVAVSRGRQTTGDPATIDPGRQLLVRGAACSAIALGLLAPTPTKFVNHFGAAAAAPTVFLAAALLSSTLHPSLRRPRHRARLLRPRLLRYNAGAIAATAGTAILVGAVSLSFAGPNLWRPYSDRGQPFGNHLVAAHDQPDLASMWPKLGPVHLANPLLWVAVALAAACWMWWSRRRGRDTSVTPERTVLLAGSITMVVMTIVVFVWAPLRQYPGWSVALSAVRAMQGQPCALAHYIQVLVNTAAQPVPAGPAIAQGAFVAAAGQPPPVPPPAPGTPVWHKIVDSGPQTGTGLLETPWFALPAGDSTHLLVPLLGTGAGRQLTLEYATASGASPAVAGIVALPVDSTVPRTEWQQVAIALDRLGQRRPSRVRLVIHDHVTEADGGLAVGPPRLAAALPLTALAAGRAVYVDQVTATLLPCLDQVGVEHGIARAPEMLVLGDEGFSRHFLDLGFEVFRGGTQVPADRSATTVRLPAQLVPSGPLARPWGRVERMVYDHPVGLVDLHVTTLQRAGWTRLPTLADQSYHGDPTG